MGSVISQLCILLAKNGCRPSVVAAQLTFAPPDPPFYELREQANTGDVEWALDPIVVRSEFRDVKIWIIKTETGTFIPGFLFKHPDAKLTILFSHGNAADCGSMREHYIDMCRKLRVNVFGYDYSGYGAASGEPSEAQTYADIRAVYDHIVSRGICTDPAKQLVLYGQSVGSGPSVNLATDWRKRPIRGMILHAPIMSGIRVLVMNRGPLACCDIYPNINRIPKVNSPVLIVHGDQDQEVGIHHGKSLHSKVPSAHRHDGVWVRGAGHNDIVDDFPDQYYPAVGRFLRALESEDYAEEGPTVTEVPPRAPTRSAAQADESQVMLA